MIFKILYIITICILLFVMKFSIGVTFGLLRDLWRMMRGGKQEVSSCVNSKLTGNRTYLSRDETLFVLVCSAICLATVFLVTRYTTIRDILSGLCFIVFACWIVAFILLILTRILSASRGGANPETLASALILLQLFTVCGIIFFVFGLGIGSPVLNKYTPLKSIRFPLGELFDFDIDSEGQFYCAVGSSGRIQVYSSEGNFVRGWFVRNLGGDFKVDIDSNDMVHIHTRRHVSKPVARHYIYSKEGKLIESLYNPKVNDVYFTRNAQARHEGVLYQMRGRHIFPIIERV